MLPQEIVRRKRDGVTLSEAEIEFFVSGLADGSIGEGQVAAFAMAVFFRGMDMAERVALTRAMMRSGDQLSWRDTGLDGPVLDKHSTGGVGDKVSLMLAPIVAACGAFVPMISGRGLGHTGGTLDKLESIPGYTTQPDNDRFRQVVREVGCAIIGQTGNLAPADKRFYAIRDVTATVESIALITASILSKKLAAGLEGLAMDVKTGSGAFAADIGMARELADSIVQVANGAGVRTTALITDMNQVLGVTAGNAVEVREAVDYLTGSRRDPRLHAVTMALAGEMLATGRLAPDPTEGRTMAERVLASGRAAETFDAMLAALGGPRNFLARVDHNLPRAAVVRPILPLEGGFVAAMDVRAIGVAVIELGGGRRAATDAIDHSVGFTDVVAVGQRVDAGRPLAMVHARDEAAAAKAANAVRAAIRLAERPPAPEPMIHARVSM